MQTMRMTMPGAGLKTEKMPGHWVLARLGKRVLRPGGIQLTRRMLDALKITHSDDVVEFAPGMGITTRLTLERAPATYTAIERNDAAAKIVGSFLKSDRQKCVVGNASDTQLPDECASVVYGEAMLTMQTDEVKRQIVREAYRLLKPGGRYGIHEMCLGSEDLDESVRRETERALMEAIHHGVKPLAVAEWSALLESEGFEVESIDTAPMSLLEPGRLIRDESLVGALRFGWNLLRDSEARGRVFDMREVFRRHAKELGALAIVARKH